jgi:pilus assembly protein CpaE
MRSIAVNDSLKLSTREAFSTGEPVTVVAIGLDEESIRFLSLFESTSSLIRVRSKLDFHRTDLDPDSMLEQMGALAPDICLLDFDNNRRLAVILAERIHSRLPGIVVFAVSAQSQPNAILEAMRCGCNEYLAKPLDRDQLTRAVIRIGVLRKDKQDQKRAQVLAFMGAKGGCGVTTLVTQLGALLASSFSRSTLLLDLHPDFGDAALYLKLTKTRYHFFELLENSERLDADFLESFLLHHSSGLQLIPAPEGSVVSHDGFPQGSLNSTVEFLRSRYEFIVVDLPSSLNHDNLSIIHDCEQLYLVTVAEVSAVRNVVRQLEYFREKDIPRDKIRVVLNRHHKRNVVTDAQIEKAIEQKIYWRVPNQYPQVVKTIHEGDPIGQLSNSEVSRSLQDWAGEIGRKPGADVKKGGGLLGLWGR